MSETLPEKRRTGRPTILSINKAYEIVHAIRVSGSIEGAAALCGISRRTYYNWHSHGERVAVQEAKGYRLDPEDATFAILYRDVLDELALLERENFGIVQKAARDGTWQAAAWILERRFPDRWARRGPRNSPVHINTDQVTIKQDR